MISACPPQRKSICPFRLSSSFYHVTQRKLKAVFLRPGSWQFAKELFCFLELCTLPRSFKQCQDARVWASSCCLAHVIRNTRGTNESFGLLMVSHEIHKRSSLWPLAWKMDDFSPWLWSPLSSRGRGSQKERWWKCLLTLHEEMLGLSGRGWRDGQEK